MDQFDLKELQEQRNTAAAKIKELGEKFDREAGWPSDEDEQRYNDANTAYDEVKQRIDRAVQANEIAARQQELEEKQERSGNDPTKRGENRRTKAGQMDQQEARALAMQGWMRNANDLAVDQRHRDAAEQIGVDLSKDGFEARLAPAPWSMAPSWVCGGGYGPNLEGRKRELLGRVQRESRAQTITTSGGGYTVPEGFMAELEVALLQFGGPLNIARILRTDSGNPLPWPSLDDTSNSGEDLAINTAAATDEDLVFGTRTLNAYKASSKAILVPTELMEDSAFNMAEVIGAALGERLGRRLADKTTTGTGSSQAQGIVTGATVGKTAASASAITGDELLDLQHSVDPAYRSDPSCGWAWNDSTMLAVRKLKDGDSNYLWQPGLTLGEPDRFLGKPYSVIQEMASIGSSAKTVLFGCMSKFLIRMVRGVRFYRLEERYREADQTGFVAFLRYDSRVIDAGTNPIKVLQQAA